MGIHSLCQGALLCFCLSLIFSVSFCYGGVKTVEVVGLGECADCKLSNIKTSQAFSGLKVTIDCKSANGEFKTRGVGELNEEGKFEVSLPQEIVKDQNLEEECFAQLHSASATPCPAHNDLEASKVVFKSKTDEKHTFGLAGKLKFSPVTCTSAFLFPFSMYPPLPTLDLPPLPKTFPKFFDHPFPFPFPPKVCPPIYKKPLPPPVPIYKKPLPPPVPIYKPKPKPPVPVYKPKPKPPVPVYKPKPKPPPVPIYKPKPKPHVPVYKPKPKPPPVPIYKPKPKPPVPVYKPKPKPPVPIYKPKPKPPIYKPLPPPVPIYKKPLPPPLFPEFPPVYKKPCPPLPKFPKIPPKYFHHPKIGFFPPLPPFIPLP